MLIASNNDGVEWGNLAQWVGPWIGAGVALVLALWGKFSRQDEAVLADLKDDIDGLRADDARLFERVDKVESDVAALKADIGHLPTVADVHEVKVAVATLSATLGAKFEALGDKIDTVIAQTERAQERLARREDDMMAQRLKDRN